MAEERSRTAAEGLDFGIRTDTRITDAGGKLKGSGRGRARFSPASRVNYNAMFAGLGLRTAEGERCADWAQSWSSAACIRDLWGWWRLWA